MLVGLVLVTGCSTGAGGAPVSPAPVNPGPVNSAPARPGPVNAGPAIASVDTTGAPLPAAVTDTARVLDAALSSGDPTPVRDRYSPAPGAASWTVVADRLSDPANQAKLASALRNPPEPRPEIAYLFSDGDHGFGLTADGRLAFVGVGQRAPGAATGTPAPSGQPYWAGRSYGHGRSLDADPSGTGLLTFRTYETCPSQRPGVPCEPDGPQQVGRVELRIYDVGGGPWVAEVVTSNDEPEFPVGDLLPVEEPAPGVVLLGSGDRTLVFCKDGVTHDGCGA